MSYIKCKCIHETYPCLGYFRSHCELTDIPTNIPSSVTTIVLLNNSIAELPSGAFSYLANCTYLSLDRNKLTALNNAMFTGLKSLKRLGLWNNEISFIEAFTFMNLTSLLRLNLDGNDLTLVKKEMFSGLLSLQWLFLHRNRIYSIEESSFSCMPEL